MPTTDAQTLRSLSFLRDARPEVAEALASAAVERRFAPGQVILSEGGSGREFYLIVDGAVEVVKGRDPEATVLGRRGPGEFIGEMAFFDAGPRFATVRALEPTRVLEFSEAGLQAALARQPELLFQTVRVLAARLREADTRTIADLQRKNQELARAYRDLQEAQASLVEKERLEHELALAREMQESILPREFPDIPAYSFAARSYPARQVGGDFYDVISLRNGRIGLVMADVSDKGMSAALYMALARSLIRAEARRSSSARLALLSVHRLLLEMTQGDTFVTVFYGVLDPSNGTLRYARAGHDRPLLFRPSTGKVQLLGAPGMLLGCVKDVTLEEATVSVKPGDLLVLYTDGVTDAISPSGESFGRERLEHVVLSADGQSAEDLCARVFGAAQAFQADAPQYDDMAVMVVRARQAPDTAAQQAFPVIPRG